ncbi:hypothetical protein [uncultured Parabacteroides sp.]|uniref:hypothetical protein n=1 Tax=uncultured Parabacteroides sp. TaxID=512312 RepID=UPI0025FEBCE0|nr:hypothetical protein [uncultured Parabacteroides sp.]
MTKQKHIILQILKSAEVITIVAITAIKVNDTELKNLITAKKNRRGIMKRLKLVQYAVVQCAVSSL